MTEEVVRVRGERIDLVELQLRIADGGQLGFDRGDVTLEGHAIEARVYAEDSFGGFLPQAGRADLVRWPSSARVDHALESGRVVSTSFDPMLGKVIAWGEDREAARANLVAALDSSAVLGLTTNLGFVRALAASDEFQRHDDRHGPARQRRGPTPERRDPPEAGRVGRCRPEQPALRGRSGRPLCPGRLAIGRSEGPDAGRARAWRRGP
ncbi:hypothetical protein LP418_10260 [Nocardioides sp. B-3]|nr:hypothetical protein LP418_10260 [Nocardioides sp. B-3]